MGADPSVDATCRLGVAQWNGREAIRENLRAFIVRPVMTHFEKNPAKVRAWFGSVGLIGF
jgi:hypothetical protein